MKHLSGPSRAVPCSCNRRVVDDLVANLARIFPQNSMNLSLGMETGSDVLMWSDQRYGDFKNTSCRRDRSRYRAQWPRQAMRRLLVDHVPPSNTM